MAANVNQCSADTDHIRYWLDLTNPYNTQCPLMDLMTRFPVSPVKLFIHPQQDDNTALRGTAILHA